LSQSIRWANYIFQQARPIIGNQLPVKHPSAPLICGRSKFRTFSRLRQQDGKSVGEILYVLGIDKSACIA
jgi:hypothetical protein